MPVILDTKKTESKLTLLENYKGTSATTTITLYSLQSLNEAMKTNVTPYQTLGVCTPFFFPEDPRIFSYEAMVMVTSSFGPGSPTDYQSFKLATIPGSKIKIEYENTSRTGYILTSIPRLNTSIVGFAAVSFSMFCSDYYDVQS